ncbi:MAG: PfkB family carbohydrate kinase [Acidimicrobiales bacterium]
MRALPRLFCLDTVMIDVVMRIASVPERGSDILASEHLLAVGGGFNAMSSFARQGAQAVYAGKLGTGPFSEIARAALAREEIDVPIELATTLDAGFCVALIDDEGERTFITAAGAEGTLRAHDLEQLSPANGDVVLVSGYNVMYPGQADIVLAWLMALSPDIVVAFDPSNRVDDIPIENLGAMLLRADWTLCNEIEASSLSGEESLDDSVVALLTLTGRRGVVVRHGATGCTIARPGQAVMGVQGVPTEVVDTNGAGDTHSGVFLAELSRGTKVYEAALRANAAASSAIATLGPATCPTRDAVSAAIEWL